MKINYLDAFSDNYIWTMESEGKIAIVDPGDAKPIHEYIKKTGYVLTDVLITHHHWDHTDGIQGLYERWQCKVIGPAKDSTVPIAHLSQGITEGNSFLFAESTVKVIHTPGHTLDMINFYLPSENILFSGDTLFSLGCGRVFEGDMNMMYNSINKISALPDKTTIYCSHEYTIANGKFALNVEGDNKSLIARINQVEELIAANKPTIPTTLELEKQTNPFLRTSSPSIRNKLGLKNASEVEVFSALRTAKDNF